MCRATLVGKILDVSSQMWRTPVNFIDSTFGGLWAVRTLTFDVDA